MLMLTDKYVTILTANGKKYYVNNDGGHGPMSTGSDEWGEYGFPGKFTTEESAIKIAKEPNIGYGRAPLPSKRTVYRVVLEPVCSFDTDPEEIKKMENEKRRAALTKLTDEEIRLLGISIK